MSVRVPGSPSLAERADMTAKENYATMQDEAIGLVRRRFAARNMHLDRSDFEEAYCQAWHGVCVKITRGEEIKNLMGMLVEITWRRAVDAYREQRPAQHADVDVEQQVAEVDIDEQLDDQARLKHFIARLKGRLNQRECEAVSLCLIHGYSRPEARRLLGISDEARMQKIMDGATKKIGPVVASITARGCGGEEWARLLRAYALGAVTPEDRDYARAEKHIAECPPCKRYVMGLRGLAAIVPPVGLPFMPASGHEGSILAHLKHLFAGHGSASAVQAGTGTAAGGGGAGLLGSVGAGTAAKGAAVLAIVAVTAVVTVKPGHAIAKHHSRPRVARIAQQAPSPPSEPAVSPARESFTPATEAREDSSTTRRSHAAVRRHRHGGARHGTAESLRPAPAPAPGASRASTPQPSAAAATNTPAVEKEFGPER